MHNQTAAPKVVIIGGGFAGLGAARRLARHDVDVTLVDRHNFHTFQPLLYQVATAGLEPADVAYPLRTILSRHPHRVFRHGQATSVDLEGRAVTLEDGTVLEYDYLVVATGATAGFFGIAGAADRSRPLYTLGDARRVRNEVLGRLEAADAKPADFDGGAPVFVVVGGGPTGVEMAGALVELIDVAIRRDGLRLDPDRTKVILVDAGDRLLAGFDETAGRYAEETLRSRGVEVRLRSPVAEVTTDGVHLANGEELRAAAVIWAGGVTVDGTLAATLATERGRGGRVALEPDLSVPGHAEVFVVGDAGAVPRGPDRTDPCPQVAQVAIQSGEHAGRQILTRVAGQRTAPFSYRDKGLMATIGRRAAVAQLHHGLILRGTLGWLAWLGLHLIYLVGFRNRVLVLVNWFWRYVDWPSGPRLIVADAESEP